MRTLAKSIFHILIVVLFTVISQVGGVIYAIHLVIYKSFRIRSRWVQVAMFSTLYLLVVFLAIPPLARLNNRVPLPVFKTNTLHLGPHTMFTSLACRNYVRPELKQMIVEIVGDMNDEFPGVKVQYLDANFPLMKRFRMYPHLRHDNGKKLDISFIYKNVEGSYSNKYNSLFGYGYSAKPLHGEYSKPFDCGSQGFWQYNIIEKYVPDQKWRKHEFALEENTALLSAMAAHPTTRYVIIEPHLQERMALSEIDNIGSLGCWAIRHDDHMHVQAY